MTLIEWMVSITIGLVLLAGLSILIAQQSRTQAELEKSSRQIENGRYAMQLLQEDIQLAGYMGEYAEVGTAPSILPNPCLVTPVSAVLPTDALSSALPFHVQGYDSPGSTLPAEFADCPLLAANHMDGTDILVVRRADTEVVTGALVPGQVYLQSGLTVAGLTFSYALAKATTTAVDTTLFPLKLKDGATAAPLRKYLVNIYFVSPCNVPTSGSSCSAANTDDGGVSVPTLKRLALTAAAGATVFTTSALVEGIESMQIDYGFDTTGDDGSPDTYAKEAVLVADWANVMAVRLNLLARNNETSAGYQDLKTYNLGLEETTTAAGDGFKRRVFSQLVRVINPSSRRDQ